MTKCGYLADHFNISSSLASLDHAIAAIIHGKPRPKKTLTEFDPVTLPTAESAVSSATAAALLANVSGSDVPRATKVIAVTESSRSRTQPNNPAISPIKAVTRPM